MSTLRTNTLSNVAGTASTAIENAINGSAKAWVNFNGTGTVAIRGSYNVTSITDNGAGWYTVNFTNAMPDANYASHITTNDSNWGAKTSYVAPTFYLSSSLQVYNFSGSGSTNNLVDTEIVSVTVFR